MTDYSGLKPARVKPNWPRECIFDARRPLSGEHVFPAWMRDHLPAEGADHGTLHTIRRIDGNSAGPLTQKGDHRSRKLKVVCVACNNGWMSRLQDKVKPVLLPMMLGAKPQLLLEDQQLLATWAAMFTIIVDQADPETAAIGQRDRTYFQENQVPPWHWIVWVSEFCGDYRSGAFAHRAFHMEETDLDFPCPPGLNVQSTIFAAGKCLFQVFSAQSPDATWRSREQLGVYAARHGLQQIWPPIEVAGRVINVQPFQGHDFDRLQDLMSRELGATWNLDGGSATVDPSI